MIFALLVMHIPAHPHDQFHILTNGFMVIATGLDGDLALEQAEGSGDQ